MQFSLRDPLTLVLIGALLSAGSGVPGLLYRRNAAIGQKAGASLLLIGAAIGLAGTIAGLISPPVIMRQLQSLIDIDALSSIFLLIIFIVSGCASLYATKYWPADSNRRSEPQLTFFLGLLSASLAFLVLARNSVVFLIAWEIMALSCFFCIIADDREASVREAGALYLIATHAATLSLFATFSLLKATSGSFSFPGSGTLTATAPLAAAIFITGLVGFGLKAGLMPLHIWLPSAHANAPGHVSAIMSGVLIKTGIYGIVRILSFFHDPPVWWGVVILIVGIVSAVVGVIFALGQHDIKRLLAYHSIENIGIINIGIGVATIGAASGNTVLISLGIAGALLHVINHALFKSLLFLGAGSVIHTIHTREIDAMGGIGRRMPYTSIFFLIGSIAICGLPPFNGFVSEFLIYIGIFKGVTAAATGIPYVALSAPALALVGALAVACFIKVYGTTFLGTPRTPAAEKATESPWQMLLPMGGLAFLCILIGVIPGGFAPLLTAAASTWSHHASEAHLASYLRILTVTTLILAFAALLLTLFLVWRIRRSPVATGNTWDCGYLLSSPRIQYTSSSFAEMFVKIFRGLLHPHYHNPSIKGAFPENARFGSHVPETVLDIIILPLFHRIDNRLSLIRRVQHGQLPLYILYIFIALVSLLVWSP